MKIEAPRFRLRVEPLYLTVVQDVPAGYSGVMFLQNEGLSDKPVGCETLFSKDAILLWADRFARSRDGEIAVIDDRSQVTA